MSSSIHLTEELALLEALPAFELFQREALQIIAFSSDVRQLRAGETLFKRGQISDSGYLVLAGSVSLDGGEIGRSEPSVFARGALIGAQAMFAATERPATAVIKEDCRLMRISRSIVLRVLETFPETADRLRQKIATEAGDTLALFARVISVLNRDITVAA
jgi:CRP-like cAMP-binding protein